MTEPTIPFHTFLWKVGSRCNINCTYCYVYNSVDDRWRDQPRLMSPAVARATADRMARHLSAHGKSSAAVIFHGGEPLLGGVRHLSMITSVIRDRFAGTGIEVSLGMQTNLLLLDEPMADFLLEHGFSLGVSLDGPPEVNDRYRLDKRGRPTSALLEEKLGLLLGPRYRSMFGGFLCVVDPETDPRRVTDYLLSFDPIGIDFLFPLDNHDRLPPGKRGDTDSTAYGEWLTQSFDHWLSRPNTTRVRIFQSIINMMCGGPSLVESLGLRPVDLIVVETNGEIEAVDSLKTTFRGATRLGFHVDRDDFDDVARHIAVRSRQLGATSLADQCRRCDLVEVCGGGYLPHRYSTARGFDNPSVYCADLQLLIEHIHRSLARAVRPVLRQAERRAAANGFASSAGMERAHQPIRRLARDALGGGGSVVDCGCGDGTLLRGIAADTGATPYGLELDEDKVRLARRVLAGAGGEARVANVYGPSWPWPDLVFDLCLLPLSALLAAPAEPADALRATLAARARALLVYAYDDDLRRYGSLVAMADLAGLRLVGDPDGGIACLAELPGAVPLPGAALTPNPAAGRA